MTDRPHPLDDDGAPGPEGDPVPPDTAGTPDNLILVGQVLTARGLHGELRVLPVTSNAERFRQGRRVLLNGEERRIVTSRPTGKGQVLLVLDGITTLEAAAALRGAGLYVREEEAPPLEADWYYHFQLLGLNVVTDEGRELGVLAQILETGANDVYIVRGEREFLIPAIADVVQEIDLEAKRMTIHPLPGLLD